MKRKFFFPFLAAIVGCGSAFAAAKRCVVVYVHYCPDSKFTKVSPFDPANCGETSTTFCYYTVSCSVPLPDVATEAQLIAAGGVGHNFGTCYVQP